MFLIEKYHLNHKSIWDSFIDVSKNGTFLFKRDFMDYHSDRFEDHSLLIYKNSELVALFPANIESENIYSHQGLTYGGLIVNQDIKLNDFISCFGKILKYFHNKFFKNLFIKEIPPIYNSNFSDELGYISFITNSKIYRKDIISVIDLNSKIKISNDRFQGYKRGLKNNLKIKETIDLKEFWNNILITTLSKKHSVSPVHSINEIQKLKNIFEDNIRQFNIYHNDEIVAGTTIFQTKNVIHIQYIGSDTNKNKLGSLDFLFYKLINELFTDYKFFDFGTSNENNGRKINSGLLYWKEGFGARTLTQNFYKFDTSNYNDLNNLML